MGISARNKHYHESIFGDREMNLFSQAYNVKTDFDHILKDAVRKYDVNIHRGNEKNILVGLRMQLAKWHVMKHYHEVRFGKPRVAATSAAGKVNIRVPIVGDEFLLRFRPEEIKNIELVENILIDDDNHELRFELRDVTTENAMEKYQEVMVALLDNLDRATLQHIEFINEVDRRLLELLEQKITNIEKAKDIEEVLNDLSPPWKIADAEKVTDTEEVLNGLNS